jgi:hypothetical protein
VEPFNPLSHVDQFLQKAQILIWKTAQVSDREIHMDKKENKLEDTNIYGEP